MCYKENLSLNGAHKSLLNDIAVNNSKENVKTQEIFFFFCIFVMPKQVYDRRKR
jgi:hypothetical protein